MSGNLTIPDIFNRSPILKDQLLTGIFTYVLPSSLVWQVKTDEKTVYLTFDDGPIPGIDGGNPGYSCKI